MLEKKWFQHTLAIIAFIIVALAFCRPALEGKLLIASDNFQTIGSLKEGDDYVKKHKETMVGWSGHMFSGMPIARGKHPNVLVKSVYSLKQGPHAHSYDLILWLMISFYILCLALEINIAVAAGISIAFAFTGFNIMSMEAGHFQKIFAFAMIPGTLAGLIYLMKGKLLKGAIFFILFLNLLVGVNHTQLTYYAVIISFITFIFLFAKYYKNYDVKYMMKVAGVGVVAIVLSILANISVFYTSVLAEATTRGGQSELTANQSKGSGLDRDYAASWSMDGVEFFSYFIPNFAGGPSGYSFLRDKNSNTYKAFRKQNSKEANALQQKTTAYWGNQPFVGGGFYMGAALTLLFILFLVFNRDYKRFWLGSLFVIVLLMALGKNFSPVFNFLFDYLPLFDKFRVPSMINLLMQAIIALGAALALNQIIKKEIDPKQLNIALLSILGVIAALLVLSPMFFDFYARGAGNENLPGWLNEALRKDRIALMRKDGLKSIVIMALCGGITWAYINNKLKNSIVFVLLIGAIASADTIMNASKHVNAEKFTSKRKAYNIFKPTAADRQILADKDIHYRVLNLTRSPFNDAITSYHHKSIGGYHGAKLRRYNELIEYQISRNNRAVWNMLNTKYLITKGANGPQAQRNPGALGPAWFVDSLSIVANGDEEMNGLNAPFNPKQYAMMQQSYADDNQSTNFNSSNGNIKIDSYSPDKMVYTSNNNSDGFAVFSEIYYKLKDGTGWDATIDGEPVDIKKVNFTLRGLNIPAGTHEIIFTFNKKIQLRYHNIRKIFSIITILLILGLIGLFLFQSRKGELKETI